MSALERAVTALGARPLPTFSEGAMSSSGPGIGEARASEEIKVARSKDFEASEKDRGSISWELSGTRRQNEEPKPWGRLGDSRSF